MENLYTKISYFVAITFPLMLAGCHTMEGVGTDIKQAGQSLENAAETKEACPTCPCCSSRIYSPPLRK